MSIDDNPTGVGLDVMVTARLPAPHGYLYRAGGGTGLTRLLAALRPGAPVLPCPCLAFAIRHPAAGTILIDTGMHPDAAAHRRRDFGAAMSLMFRNLRPADESFAGQLHRLGIAPDGVQHVLMTHLHVDHTSGMRELRHATFICSRREWAATRAPLAAGKGYVRHHLPAADRMSLVDLEGDGVPFGPFARTIDLLGDGSVRLIWTPGHTVGHLSVLLRLAHGQQVLLVGDAAYTLRNIHEQLLPLLTADDRMSLQTLRELRAFAEHEPAAILVPSHDPTAWHALAGVSASAQRELEADATTR